MPSLPFFRRSTRSESKKHIMNRPSPECFSASQQYQKQLEEYTQLAGSLDFSPTALKEAQIKLFCTQNGIPVYKTEEVVKYLDTTAFKLHKGWMWLPLRTKDIVDHTGTPGFYVIGSQRGGGYTTTEGTYTKFIPGSILQNAKRLEHKFPDLTFVVSEIVEHPDPFIAVMLSSSVLVIFGVWDEPGFTG